MGDLPETVDSRADAGAGAGGLGGGAGTGGGGVGGEAGRVEAHAGESGAVNGGHGGVPPAGQGGQAGEGMAGVGGPAVGGEGGGQVGCDPCDCDGDGAIGVQCQGNDCDDEVAAVRPGQPAFFLEESPSNGFDYDCSGTIAYERAIQLTCNPLACNEVSQAFIGIPTCGVEDAAWGRCVKSLLECNPVTLSYQPVKCH